MSYAAVANLVFQGQSPITISVNPSEPPKVIRDGKEVDGGSSVQWKLCGPEGSKIEFEKQDGRRFTHNMGYISGSGDPALPECVALSVRQFFDRVRIVHANVDGQETRYAVILRGPKVELAKLAP